MLLPMPLFLSLTLLVVDENDLCSVQQAQLHKQENVAHCQVHLPWGRHRNITKVLPHFNLQVLIHLPSRSTAFQRSQFVAVHYDNDYMYYIGEVVDVLSSEKELSALWNTAPLSRLHLHGQRCQTCTVHRKLVFASGNDISLAPISSSR